MLKRCGGNAQQETQDDGQGNSIEHLMILQRCQQINVASIQSLSKTINSEHLSNPPS